MSEALFVELYITQALTAAEARLQHGISHRKYFEYKAQYGPKYATQLRALKSARYAASKHGNKYGAREQPAVVLDRDVLEQQLREGHSLAHIAALHKTSRWLVRQNITYHRLQYSLKARLPVFIGRHNRDLLEQLEVFAPGITESAAKAYDDADTFFERAYTAHCAVLEVQEFLSRLGRVYNNRYRVPGQPGVPVSFSKNIYEARVAQGLRARGIPHVRAVVMPGTAHSLDFLVDGLVFVEIDGEYHSTTAQQERDKWKEERLMRPLLRFSTEKVRKDLPSVLETIAAKLASLTSSASSLRASPLFTTSK